MLAQVLGEYFFSPEQAGAELCTLHIAPADMIIFPCGNRSIENDCNHNLYCQAQSQLQLSWTELTL